MNQKPLPLLKRKFKRKNNHLENYWHITQILCSFLDFLNSNGEKKFLYNLNQITKQIEIINYFKILINLIIIEIDKLSIKEEEFNQLFEQFNLKALDVYSKIENYKLKIPEKKSNLILSMKEIDNFLLKLNDKISNDKKISNLMLKIPLQIDSNNNRNQKNPKEIYEILIKDFNRNQLPKALFPITDNSYFEFENCIEHLNYYIHSL